MSGAKYIHMLLVVLAFVIVSHPKTYKLTSKLLPFALVRSGQEPTLAGIFIHAAVFLILLKLIWWAGKRGYVPRKGDE